VLCSNYFFVTRGDAFRCASRLPLAILFRAFGAGALPLAILFRAFGAGPCPGYSISRLRRWGVALAILFRAFGAGPCPGYSISRLRRWALPWLFYFAPSALSSDFWCKALLICKSKRSRFAGGGEGADVGTVADEVFVVRGVGDEDGATLEGGVGNVFALQKQRAHFATTRAER